MGKDTKEGKDKKQDPEVEMEKKPCNARIDELAKPNKRLLAAVWEGYANIFTIDRREAVRELLQELYAMTPEETERYFAEINKVLAKLLKRERMKAKFLRIYKERLRNLAREKAYRLFAKILKKGMIYAVKHPVPALVSPRLRLMSDIVLEQLCDVRNLPVPPRSGSDCDPLAQFLINLSDWIAVAIEHIYYKISVLKNKELDAIEEQIRLEEELRRQAEGPPPPKKKKKHKGKKEIAAEET